MALEQGSTYISPYNDLEVRATADVAEKTPSVQLHQCRCITQRISCIPDQLQVMAGQGTISFELAQQLPRSKVDAVFIPVGGGGLISGGWMGVEGRHRL